MTTDTSERGFERLICTALTGKLDVRGVDLPGPDQADALGGFDQEAEAEVAILDAVLDKVEP